MRTKQLGIDVALAVAIFVLGLTSRIDVVDAGVGPFTREPDALDIALIALGTLALAARRVFPVARAGTQGSQAGRVVLSGARRPAGRPSA